MSANNQAFQGNRTLAAKLGNSEYSFSVDGDGSKDPEPEGKLTNSSSTFFAHFEQIRDPRMDHARKHLLIDILFIAICTIICGGEGFTDMESFGKAKKKWLSKFLELPHGIPSHDTFGRVFAVLDPKAFGECFMCWTQAIHEATRGDVIALDGKTIRHSFDTALGQDALHIVSAWAVKNGVSLGQMRVEPDTNEITAIPKLLNLLDISGCIVTIDAIGCQKEITKQIIDQGGDYVISLKGNQETLHDDVKFFFDEGWATGFEDVECRYFQNVEKDHGRIEVRQCWIVGDEATQWLGEMGHCWPGLRSITAVKSERKIGEKVSVETRYFISSLSGSAKKLANVIRSHWGIENSLHHVLDVTFNEDNSRIRMDNAPENLSILRKIAINAIKREKSKGSIRGKVKRAGCIP